MKSNLLIGILTICFSCIGQSQVPKFQKGITTSNLLTFFSGDNSEHMRPEMLLRYKAGIQFRSLLTDRLKLPRPFPKPKKGVAALDYGISFMASGYSFQYRGLSQYTDQWQIEVPILLVLYDRNDYWLPRKMRRKGYATFARFGIKASYLIPGKSNNILETQFARLSQTSAYGGFNYYGTVGGGLLRTNKAGHTFSLSISGNVGWFAQTKVAVDYQDQSGKYEQTEIRHHGSYLAIETIFLFNKSEDKNSKGIPPPLIFNPRY